jgi:translation initiation factor 2B subunit (eIF-2B alpha/beta/delta family)
MEGLKLAKIIGKNGIKVKLIVDSAIFSFIKDANLILLGADAITNRGLVNKIGTKGIAITAKHHNTPTYSLCSTIKFIPENYNLKLGQQKNPKEVMINDLTNVTPINYYFDLTPLDYLTGFITDKGVINSLDVKNKISHFQLYKDFY